MPEVLPAPTRVAEGAASSAVRGRTVAHMQRLLAATAATAAASCTKADTQTQTVTIPAQTSTTTASAQSTTEGSLLPPPKTTASAKVEPPQDFGYAVVDPMPAPARCMGLSSASHVSSSFKTDATGVVLEIAVTLPTGSTWAGSVFDTTNKPTPWSGTLASSNITPHLATVRIKPSQGVTSLGIALAISCNAGSGSIAVTATFTTPATATTKVSVTAVDY